MTAPGNDRGRWHGELEGFDEGLVYGWCVDREDADHRVTVEICIDGQPVASVIADVARMDLAQKFRLGPQRGDVCHGFVADLKALSTTADGVVTARVANTGASLEGVLHLDAREMPPAPRSSYVFGDGGLRVHGWSESRRARVGATIVRAFAGAREIAHAVADQTHPSLRGTGSDAAGFVLDIPPQFADGRSHSIRVVDGDGAPLHGSPVTVCCTLSGAKHLLTGKRPPALDAVIESYERYVPRSLGFSHYAAWREQFETLDGVKAPKLRAALVVPSTDAGARECTLASIEAQVGAKVTAFDSLASALDSECDVVGFVRPGDELRAHAIAAALAGFANAGVQAVYTDSEYAGRPWFKPAWNPEYALASDYPLELLLVRREFARRHACTQAASPSSSSAWRWLAAAAQQGPDAIVHVPRALYVWNSAPDERERDERLQGAQAALRASGSHASLEPVEGVQELFRPRRVVHQLTAASRATTITLIIPTRDRAELLQRCLDSIRKHTNWPGLEIIVVDNDSAEAQTHRLLRAERKRGVRVLDHPGAFNFSAMNNRAVQIAQGSVIGLINNDIEALHEGWLEEIVAQLLRPGIAAVGAKLVWPNGMVQHGGVILGVGNAAGHFGNRLAEADWGDHGRNQLALQVSAVTAACLFLRKNDYIAVGGMDEHAFPVTFNDVDLCLKLRARGDAIVWTPFARLLHAESASRGKEDAPPQRARAQRELDRLREKWAGVLLRDPAYHPSLNLDAHSHAFGGLAIPPRDRSPRVGTLST